MKVLIVGGGGREHAIAEKIVMNPQVEKLYAAPGNGGMAKIAECLPIKATDVQAITDFCVREKMDFVVVAPDDPLCLGLVDLLREKGIPAFGPEKKAAIIEGSKVFAKELMKKYGIPTANYEAFNDCEKALQYIEKAEMPIVVKADGLALGKGVLICNTREEARDAVRSMMIDNRFGMSGSRVVIEEFLTGPEVSVLAFTDGKCIKPMVSSMDHKRALDHDEGPTVHAMNAEGRTFRGCLYFGLMLTPKGPKVIEYNCRFGDPETQVVLPLLESDLLTIMQATVNGTLEQTEVRFSKKNACCVVLASGGYPQHYETGYPISGLDEAGKTAHVYHAGTKLDADGTVLTGGGRVLGVTAAGDTLEEAIAQAYQAAEKISFTDLHMRRDIGQRALAAQH